MKHLICFFTSLALTAAAWAESPWKATIISRETAQSTPNTWMIFRKDVNIDSIPASLTARIATDTKYWLWINGEQVVFEGGLKRGPSPRGTYYDEIDITPFLNKGDNTIAALVWHFGKNGFSHVNSGAAGFLFDAQGDGIEILSDTSWKCDIYDAYSDTQAPYPNYRLAESNIRFDGRLERQGWNLPGYDGKLNKTIPMGTPDNGPWGHLVRRPIPQWRNSGLQNYPKTRFSPEGDTLYCTLPYNCHVTPWLKVNAPEGKTIGMMTDNYQGGSANNVRSEYITRDGIQEYESYGWMNGHEIIYTIPHGVEVLDVKYRETGYDCDFSGTFSCDDPFLNELRDRSARTLYVTMRDNYMDCPDRERAQWWGDEVNELGETFYALSPSAWQLAAKGVDELINWQRPTGEFYSPVPSLNWGKELPLQMLASVGWYGFYTQYYYSADSSFVAKAYPAVNHYLHDVWQTDSDGLAIPRPGDWNWADWGENSDMEVLTNCWYYLALKAQKEFARILGDSIGLKQAAEMMGKIETAFDNRFWTGTEYRSPSHKGETDDRANAMAVVARLSSPDHNKAIAHVLNTQYHASPYMEKYVLEALFMLDRPDDALARMHKRYEKMLSYDGYTTLFEGWGIGAEGFGGGTINHAWSGGPLTLLSQKVCGIAPTSPGFKTFEISPQMGYLKKASATVDTKYGLISVDLTRSGRKINAVFSVPDGCRATVAGHIYGPGNHSATIKG